MNVHFLLIFLKRKAQLQRCRNHFPRGEHRASPVPPSPASTESLLYKILWESGGVLCKNRAFVTVREDKAPILGSLQLSTF